jgi:hypothetical protein
MVEKKNTQKTTLKADKFTIWNKETKKNDSSSQIKGVYVKEIPKKDGSGTFTVVDVVTSTGTHQAFLNAVDEKKAELHSKLNKMTEEEIEELSQALSQ